MLIIEGFQISNHDILALSEELFVNAKENQFINKLYISQKNVKIYRSEPDDEWYSRYLNHKLRRWVMDKVDNIYGKLVDSHANENEKTILLGIEIRKRNLNTTT